MIKYQLSKIIVVLIILSAFPALSYGATDLATCNLELAEKGIVLELYEGWQHPLLDSLEAKGAKIQIHMADVGTAYVVGKIAQMTYLGNNKILITIDRGENQLPLNRFKTGTMRALEIEGRMEILEPQGKKIVYSRGQLPFNLLPGEEKLPIADQVALQYSSIATSRILTNLDELQKHKSKVRIRFQEVGLNYIDGQIAQMTYLGYGLIQVTIDQGENHPAATRFETGVLRTYDFPSRMQDLDEERKLLDYKIP